MSQLAEIDEDARTLLFHYREQSRKLADLRETYGSGHELVRNQAKLADLDARELHENFDLDADELLEQLKVAEFLKAYDDEHIGQALRSVRDVTVLKHDLGAVGRFAELPLGTRQPVSIPLRRTWALETLLEHGAIALDRHQELRVTTTTRYHRVVLTGFGMDLLARFEQ